MESEYNTHGEAIERRRHTRAAGDLMAVLKTGREHGVPCRLRDVSLSGARLESACRPDTEDDFSLLFRVPSANVVEHVLVSARIVWLEEVREGRITYGVQFLNVSGRGQAVIDEYVAASSEAECLCRG